MRIILQHAGNGLYFQNPGVWTANVADAFDFGTSETAQKFVTANGLCQVKLVAAFVEGKWLETVALPLGDPALRQPNPRRAATLG